MKRLSIWITTCALILPMIAHAQSPGDLGSLLPAGADWSWWRGPTLDGKAPDQKPPLKWDLNTHLIWKTEVPGRGHASPIVHGPYVFTATADEKALTQSLVCYDRATGKPLWGRTVHQGGFTPMNRKNSHASATPACDGQRVYGVFINANALWVSALTLDGKPAWQTKVGDFGSQHGYGSSPQLYKNLLIVNGDNQNMGYIAALDRNTGKIVWKTNRQAGKPSYATPALAVVAGRPQILLHGGVKVTSYNPDTGKLLWSADAISEVTGNTIATDGSMVFASGGYPTKELSAIKADGKGDVTRSHIAWSTKDPNAVAYCPSAIVHEGRLYVVNDRGSLTCFDTATGKSVWSAKLAGGFSASLIYTHNHLMAFSEDGVATVFKPGDKFEPVAENRLPASSTVQPGGHMATPAVAGHRLYIRCGTTLYCIGDRATASSN